MGGGGKPHGGEGQATIALGALGVKLVGSRWEKRWYWSLSRSRPER